MVYTDFIALILRDNRICFLTLTFHSRILINELQEKSKNLGIEFLSDNIKIIISVFWKEISLYVQNHTD